MGLWSLPRTGTATLRHHGMPHVALVGPQLGDGETNSRGESRSHRRTIQKSSFKASASCLDRHVLKSSKCPGFKRSPASELKNCKDACRRWPALSVSKTSSGG